MIETTSKNITANTANLSLCTASRDSEILFVFADYKSIAPLDIQLELSGIVVSRPLETNGNGQIDLMALIPSKKSILLSKNSSVGLKLSRQLLSGELISCLVSLTPTGNSNSEALLYSVGDTLLSMQSYTGLVEKGGLLWVPMGFYVRRMNVDNHAGTVGDSRLEELYKLLWNVPEIQSDGNRGVNHSADWLANKWLKLPDIDGRALAVASSVRKLGSVAGAEKATISVNNLPPHNHDLRVKFKDPAQGAHEHYYGDGLAEAPRDGSPSGGYGATATVGGGQEFSILSPTYYGLSTLLICAGAA